MENLLKYVQEVLATTPERWMNLTERLPGDLLARPPAPQEWSALACLGHLLDTERWVFPVRVRAFLSGVDFEAFQPDSQGTPITAETEARQLAAEFFGLRTASLELLQTVSVSDLTRRARHSELGMVTLEEMLNEWAAHDLMHTVQAERALMQPFLAGVGPWRPYFSDHDIQGQSPGR
jgi:hypothetical protein